MVANPRQKSHEVGGGQECFKELLYSVIFLVFPDFEKPDLRFYEYVRVCPGTVREGAAQRTAPQKPRSHDSPLQT